MQSRSSTPQEDGFGRVRRLLQNNPLFATALGLCPALAVSYRVDNAIAMGGAVFVVLLLSNVTFSLIGGKIPRRLRFFSELFIASCYTTIVELVFQAYAPAVLGRLGIYLPLIAVNCLVLGGAGASARDFAIAPALGNSLRIGFGFFFSLLAVSLVREVLGRGTITLFPMGAFDGVIRIVGIAAHPATLISYAAGALLVLGYLQAVTVWAVRRRKERET